MCGCTFKHRQFKFFDFICSQKNGTSGESELKRGKGQNNQQCDDNGVLQCSRMIINLIIAYHINSVCADVSSTFMS